MKLKRKILHPSFIKVWHNCPHLDSQWDRRHDGITWSEKVLLQDLSNYPHIFAQVECHTTFLLLDKCPTRHFSIHTENNWRKLECSHTTFLQERNLWTARRIILFLGSTRMSFETAWITRVLMRLCACAVCRVQFPGGRGRF